MQNIRTIITALYLSAVLSTSPVAADSHLRDIELPPGFEIERFTRAPDARSLSVAPAINTVFIGTRKDRVYALSFENGKAGKPVVLLSGLATPHGVAWKDGWLYVGEQHRIVRYPYKHQGDVISTKPEILTEDIPDNPWHGRRDLAFGPDGKLYVSIGSPCNVCMTETIEGTIIRMPPTGGKYDVFARGIRNSVGLDFHPVTGELHFTDNGADRMGDDLPPEELNRAPVAGLDFGFPYYGGGDARTPKYRHKRAPKNVTFPVVTFPAHVAPLGLHFYRGNMFPAPYRDAAFVAHHGSWDRSEPDGYRVALVAFDDQGRAKSWHPFAEGWLRSSGIVRGRPVDVAELPDGSLLVSDDKRGVVYRITYKTP